jgi:hypothetical protein
MTAGYIAIGALVNSAPGESHLAWPRESLCRFLTPVIDLSTLTITIADELLE